MNEESTAAPDHMVGRVPIRNIWLLFLYASDLAAFLGQFNSEVEDSPNIPHLIARLLCHSVEQRTRRSLSRGYRPRQAVLTRVRGRIDTLQTYADGLLRQGAIACRFTEHTLDTPRNRLVRAALHALSKRVTDQLLRQRCQHLAIGLGRQGISGPKPSRAEMAVDQIGRHDANDQLMVNLAHFVFDLVMPTEDPGKHNLTRVHKDEVLVRKLFEKAIGNFYAAELPASCGWAVHKRKRLHWQTGHTASNRMASMLPSMEADIILEHSPQRRRIVIDTKFSEILTNSVYRSGILKSGYLYQIYAYLRSQERSTDPFSRHSEGVLLHPTVDLHVDETVRIQGHNIRFVTVDLAKPATEILTSLRHLVADRDLFVPGKGLV